MINNTPNALEPFICLEDKLNDSKILKQVELHLSTLDSDPHALFCFRVMKGKNIDSFNSLHVNYKQKIIEFIKQEFDVFVVVNSTDGKGVKTNNINKVRALFVDLDKTNLDNYSVIENMKLAPNLVINTSPGKYHCYWTVLDCPLEQFKTIQRTLAEQFSGDRAVCDLPRIMRLAGSIHRKGKPHFVSVLKAHDNHYQLNELITAFNFVSFDSVDSVRISKVSNDFIYGKEQHIKKLKLNIAHGEELHNSLLSLASYFANAGKTNNEVIKLLQDEMKASQCKPDSRFKERFNEIIGLVKYVFENRNNQVIGVNGISANEKWLDPKPITSELKEVQCLDVDILPDLIKELITDASCRMQCPPDFLAAGIITVVSSIVARKIAVQPKLNDTGWVERPNLWGAIIGKPSLLKSPTLSIAMGPLDKLEKLARSAFYDDLKIHAADKDLLAIKAKNVRQKIKDTISKDNFKDEDARSMLLDINQDKPQPEQKRYYINDGTVEKVGELLKSNCLGLMYYRDELNGWFKGLNKPDNANDRSFFLESWNGNRSYTYDRIGRGTVYIPANRLSILGGIQPDMFMNVVNEAVNGDQGGDGLLQRFQIVVYPDTLNNNKFVDLPPNLPALQNYTQKVIELSVWSDSIEDDLILKLSEGAYAKYKEWYEENESLINSDQIQPALESHYAKYRGLVPSIATIFYVLNNENFMDTPFIDELSMNSAIKYVEYLKTHAERIYSLTEQEVRKGAKTILLRFDKLENQFTARDIHRRGWSGLKDKNVVDNALALLEEYGYCKQFERDNNIGRPTFTFVKHPKYQQTKLSKPTISSSDSIGELS